MTRQEFIDRNRIEDVLAGHGIAVNGGMAKCPLHDDKTPSMAVNSEQQVWFCHAGCGGGSVIDLLAKIAGTSVSDVLKQCGIDGERGGTFAAAKRSTPSAPTQPSVVGKIYQYQDAAGADAYQVVRMIPKTFRQRRSDGEGGWTWGMEGVERVLYRLPAVMAAETVALAEGEKDADTLTSLGFCGSCNVGGAGKWLDGYTESLTGKNVLMFGDNDDVGRKHTDLVFTSIGKSVKSLKLIKVPPPSKDISDYVAAFPTTEAARSAVDSLVSEAAPHVGGARLPLYTMAEIEPRYAAMVRTSESSCFDLGRWLPSFNRLRPLIPGEMVMIVGNTGIGKTALLSSIALAAKPLPTISFQFELPEELMFERFAAAATKCKGEEVEEAYKTGNDSLGENVLSHYFGHLLICCEPRQTIEQVESIVTRSEMKFGKKPKLVLIDYVQLVAGKGTSRYDKASIVAEDLKIMAKATKTIVIIASQIARKASDDDPRIRLHDAKDSGSLENSCSLVIGAWRHRDDAGQLTLQVLKGTRGGGGLEVECNFDGARMLITERPRH